MFLNGIIVSAYYEEGPVKEMIHNLKYNHALGLKKVFGKLLSDALKRCHCEHSEAINHRSLRRYTPRDDNIEIDLITFNPLHHRRLAERGFNQAEILAQEVSKLTKIPCEDLLIKTKNTKRQVGLSGKQRRENLNGVFKVRQVESLEGKNILIIDDVTTTGTTLNECAKVLKNAGAKEVWGLVVARG